MKYTLITLSISLIIMMGIIVTLCSVIKTLNNNNNKSLHIDLPEEYMTISNNADKSELLVAHISNDTLYLRFDN